MRFQNLQTFFEVRGIEDIDLMGTLLDAAFFIVLSQNDILQTSKFKNTIVSQKDPK